MTVSSEVAYVERAWTGVETEFGTGIQADATTDLRLVHRSAEGLRTALQLGVHYTATLAAGTNIAAVQPLPAMPAPPAMIEIGRETAALQPVDFQDNSRYGQDVHERIADQGAMRDAEQRAKTSLLEGVSVRVPLGETIGPLPPASQRRLKWMAGGAGGELIFVEGPAVNVTDGAADFASAFAAVGANIPSGQMFFTTAGYFAPSDFGGGLYVVRNAEPSHPGKIALAGGRWGELVASAVCPEQFGARNDKTTYDDDAADNAFAYIKAMGGGQFWWRPGAGYLLNQPHNFWPSVAYAMRWETGAYCYYGPGMAGDAGKVFFKFGHPLGSNIYGKYLVLDAPRILPWDSGASGQVGPVLIEYQRMGQTHLGPGGEIFTNRNTAFRASRVYNSKFDKCVIFGGGHHLARKVSAGTFSITTGTKNITSSLGEFDATDVNRQLFLYGTRTQQFTIASVTDANNAVVTENAVATYAAVRGNFDGIKCATTADNDVVTLETGRATADLLNRVVKIIDANTEGGSGSPLHPHRATVVEVVSATQLRLDVAPTVSQAATYISFSPVVDIYPEPEDGTNDFIWDNLTIEADHGTLIAIDKAINVRFPNLKLHANNPGFFGFGFGDDCTLFNMMLSRTTGYFGGDIEGAVVNSLARVHASGIAGLLYIGDMTGIGCDWQSLVYKSDCVSGAEVVVGNWTLNNVVGYQTIDRALMGKGSGRISLDRGALIKSAYTGTYHPRRFGVTPYDVTLAPTGAEMVAAGSSTLLGISGSEINWLAFGTSALAPTNAADFSNGVRLVSRAYAPNGTQVQNALLLVRNRNPSVGNVEGEWLVQTRNSGGTLATRLQITSDGQWLPGADNVQNIGYAGGRMAVIYAGTGTINTSDQREKQDIEDIPDEWLDAWREVRWCRYRWQAAVAEKGSAARWHVGLIAQQVRDAFAARGVDAYEIGLLCFDEWHAEPARPAVTSTIVVFDEGGGERETEVEIEPAFPGREAGSRYGLRYSQCEAMEAAYARRERTRICEELDRLRNLVEPLA